VPTLKPDEVKRRVASARVARLGTVDPEYGVHLVPITFTLVGDAILTAVDHKPKISRRLRRIENIERNHHVSVLVDHYEEDWTKLWWCRLAGTARVLYQGPEFDESVEALAARYEHYRGNTPGGPVVRIAVTRWTGWTATKA
jgi:PPOX class probable F420-dependent enzyme